MCASNRRRRPALVNWRRSSTSKKRLGVTDPYRRLRQLAHLIMRKTVRPAGAANEPSIRLGE
jgi:hypothetical protein